jgi:hypothetical protein
MSQHSFNVLGYSGRKITASFGHVTVRGQNDGKGKGEARWRRVCLRMYSITENIYYSQLSSVALLLQPELNCFTSYNTRKGLGSLSLCAIILRSSSPSHASTCNGQRSSQLLCVHYTCDGILYKYFVLHNNWVIYKESTMTNGKVWLGNMRAKQTVNRDQLEIVHQTEDVWKVIV